MNVLKQNIPLVLEELSKHKVLSLDSETTGLNPHKDDVMFSLIIGVPDFQYYFNFNRNDLNYDEYNETVLDKKETLELLSPLFKDNSRLWVLANAKFDMHFLAKEGVFLEGEIYDVLVMARIEDNTHMLYSLDECAKRIGLKKDSSVEEFIKKHRLYTKETIPGKKQAFFNKHYHKVPFPIVSEYGKKDALVTLKLYEHQMEVFKNFSNPKHPECGPDIMPLVELEKTLTKTCFEIERAGMLLDVEYCKRVIAELDARISTKMAHFCTITGSPFIDSNKNIAEIFKVLGLEGGKTEKGNASFTDDVLSSIDHEVTKLILSIRADQKKVNTYFRSFLQYVDKDGLIHCNFRQSATTTGRFSITNPALQTLNSEDETTENNVRRAFIPKPDFCLVAIDYKAFEFRAMLDLAGEKNLAKKIEAGLDPHQATADMIGIPRKQAKTINFGCIAEDSLVLTNYGLIKIQNILKTHLVWDGVEFVSHDGVVFQGEKEVLEYEGLRATEDHKIFTEQFGEICFGDYIHKRGEGSIIVTEINGKPIKWEGYKFCYLQRLFKKISLHRFILQQMLCNKKDFCGQYFKQKIESMSLLKKRKDETHTTKSFNLNIRSLLGYGLQMQPEEQTFKKTSSLCRSWNFLRNNFGLFIKFFTRKLHLRTNIKFRHRQNRQQQRIYRGEYSSSDKERKSTKQRLKTYDILNCGPRHRFTVNGFLVHNCLYGMGKDKLAASLGITTKEAEVIRNKYFEALPNIKDFIKMSTYKAKTRKYIWNVFKRRYRFPDSNYAYKAANCLIQGGTADAVKVAMNRISDFLRPYKSHMILQIHDEILFNFHKDELHLIDQVKAIMENAYPSFFHKMECSVDHSWKSWGDLVEGYPSGIETRNEFQEESSSEA